MLTDQSKMFHFTISIAVLLLMNAPKFTQARAYYDEGGFSRNAYHDVERSLLEEGNKLCMKDILLVLDSSRSVGQDQFQKFIKPFLLKLVNNDLIKISGSGVQLSMIALSGKTNTRLYSELQFPGEGQPPQTEREVGEIIKHLTFDDLNPGNEDYTYSGKALKLAYEEVFKKKSPLNARKQAQDVVILFTDGKPNARMYKDKEEQIEYTEIYARKLRENGIRFIPVAVERQNRDNPEFRNFIKSLASEGDYFNAKFDDLDAILESLVVKSCEIKPGHCTCADIATTAYAEVGKKVEVEWAPPTFICGTDEEISSGIVQTPNIPNPSSFGVGSHQIAYSYSYGGNKKFQTTCVVDIEVKGYCKCADTETTTYAEVGKEVEVKWAPPTFICGTDEITSSGIVQTPNIQNPSNFGVGSHQIAYSYSYGGNKEFKTTCVVDIEVKGYCKCADTETTTYAEVGKEVEVKWAPPTFICGTEEITSGIVQTPNIPNPSSFGVGSHQIAYSYSYGDNKEFETTCVVDIKVKGCECTKVPAVQAPLLKVGESTVEVTWDVPKPTCDKDNNQHGTQDTGNLPYGTTTKEYTYQIEEMVLTCPVTIDVKAVPCAGKDYDPTKQECCCGSTHDVKNNYECCGSQYINNTSSKCCPNNNVALLGEKCLGD